MSNAGLDNWKRDYPLKERAIEILRSMVSGVSDGPAVQNGVGLFWDAHAEAVQLLKEVDADATP